jgi:hypothetical protein
MTLLKKNMNRTSIVTKVKHIIQIGLEIKTTHNRIILAKMEILSKINTSLKALNKTT